MTDIDIMPVARFNGNGMTAALIGTSRTESAQRQLADDFEAAFMAGPLSRVFFPYGVNQTHDTVAGVVLDGFSDKEKGEARLAAVLTVMRFALKSTDPSVRLLAQAWLVTFSGEYAEFHAADYLASQEEDE